MTPRRYYNCPGFHPDQLEKSIYAALIDRENAALQETVVLSNLHLDGAKAELTSEIRWDGNLTELVAGAGDTYNSTIVDCPPSLGVLTTDALPAAHTVIIVPVQTEFLALRGLKQLGEIIARGKRKGNPQLQCACRAPRAIRALSTPGK